MTIRLVVRGLVAVRGAERIAGPLDLDLASGEALVVTGENGAGKSTLLRTLAGLLPAGAGTIQLDGATGADGEPAQRLSEVAHYLGHRNAMKAGLTVGANLDVWRAFLGGRGGASTGEALDAVGLSGTERTPFGYLSAGQQRRAAIARLLVAARPAWILDEPTGALDAASQGLFASLLARHVEGGGLLIAATHQPLGIAARDLRLTRRSVFGSGSIDEADLAAAEGWS
ncbi:cytochrome C biogenesis protein [Aureimonas sp. Leaf454]|uniref:heme ABC exporter ATP-binding protein CcmA n=1 Tax=Aureimonas sp. Leaf454 TaxID=1736381 RepID=UPI0006F9499A|nr:heme ABC exporter ATP-binding protein CcmA [Aureimonas sp. Leaf454]KQT52054.1 cytochrome C biogenesis protein [Aureimonas sp. Leaf454]